MKLMRAITCALLFAVLFSGCASQSPHKPVAASAKPDAPDHLEAADIREAVFRHQFEHNASGQQQSAKVYFLAITGKDRKSRDPSDEFMARFANHTPPVRKASAAKTGADIGVIDRSTGEHGLVFHNGDITTISPTEVEVHGGYYEGGLSSSGNTYVVEKQNGKWVVTQNTMHWISESVDPNRTPPADRFSSAVKNQTRQIRYHFTVPASHSTSLPEGSPPLEVPR